MTKVFTASMCREPLCADRDIWVFPDLLILFESALARWFAHLYLLLYVLHSNYKLYNLTTARHIINIVLLFFQLLT